MPRETVETPRMREFSEKQLAAREKAAGVAEELVSQITGATVEDQEKRAQAAEQAAAETEGSYEQARALLRSPRQKALDLQAERDARKQEASDELEQEQAGAEPKPKRKVQTTRQRAATLADLMKGMDSADLAQTLGAVEERYEQAIETESDAVAAALAKDDGGAAISELVHSGEDDGETGETGLE